MTTAYLAVEQAMPVFQLFYFYFHHHLVLIFWLAYSQKMEKNLCIKQMAQGHALRAFGCPHNLESRKSVCNLMCIWIYSYMWVRSRKSISTQMPKAVCECVRIRCVCVMCGNICKWFFKVYDKCMKYVYTLVKIKGKWLPQNQATMWFTLINFLTRTLIHTQALIVVFNLLA